MYEAAKRYHTDSLELTQIGTKMKRLVSHSHIDNFFVENTHVLDFKTNFNYFYSSHGYFVVVVEFRIVLCIVTM